MASWHDPDYDPAVARRGCIIGILASLATWALIVLIVWALLR